MSYTVYYIDKSVGEEMERRELDPSEELLFDDLANAYYRGHCYLCGDVEVLRKLSQRVNKKYDIVSKRYSEGRAIMEAVQKVFVLSYTSNGSVLPEVLRKKKNYQFISVKTAIKEDWQLRECVLIGENLNDCAFYQIVAKWYVQQQGLGERPIHFQQICGGGDTVGGVLRNNVEAEKRPVLCLVDSDRKCGETKSTRGQVSYGSTARRAEKASAELNRPDLPPHELCCLDVHEVENLIPTQILQELQKNSPSMTEGLQLLKRLQGIRGGEPALYYDYKDGFSYIQQKSARIYWEEIIVELGGTKEDMPGTQKPKKGSGGLSGQFFKPLGGNALLERATQKMEDGTWKVDPYLVPFWKQIGAVILSWGFAAAPTYA